MADSRFAMSNLFTVAEASAQAESVPAPPCPFGNNRNVQDAGPLWHQGAQYRLGPWAQASVVLPPQSEISLLLPSAPYSRLMEAERATKLPHMSSLRVGGIENLNEDKKRRLATRALDLMLQNGRLCNQDLRSALLLSGNEDILKFYCTEYRRQTELGPSFSLRDAVSPKQQPVVRGSTQAELFPKQPAVINEYERQVIECFNKAFCRSVLNKVSLEEQLLTDSVIYGSAGCEKSLEEPLDEEVMEKLFDD